MRFCEKGLCECLLVHKSDITAFYSRSEFQMFSLISGRHVGAQLHGHQHGVSIQSSVNLCGTFRRITRVRNTVHVMVNLRSFVVFYHSWSVKPSFSWEPLSIHIKGVTRQPPAIYVYRFTW